MVGMVEDDDAGPTGAGPSDLHGVLDRLGAGAEQRGRLRVVSGGALVEPVGDLDVALVLGDEKAGVCELRGLHLHPPDYLRGARAHAGDGDARGKVDEVVAVDVDDDAAAGTVDEDRQGLAQPGWQGAVAPLLQFPRARAGQVGHEDAPLLRLAVGISGTGRVWLGRQSRHGLLLPGICQGPHARSRRRRSALVRVPDRSSSFVHSDHSGAVCRRCATSAGRWARTSRRWAPCWVADTDVTGVHVSELVDPTPYLSGGELLLTTGMPFTGRSTPARAYAAQAGTSRRGCAGAGTRPGAPGGAEPLVPACEATGLPLFSVPAPTPFLTVAPGLLEPARRGGAGTNSTLPWARTATWFAPPVSGTQCPRWYGRWPWPSRAGRRGCRRTGGSWRCGPRTAARRPGSFAHEIGRLRGAGPHSSATFPLGHEDVVVHPLSRTGRLMGFVATGSPRPMRPPDRQLGTGRVRAADPATRPSVPDAGPVAGCKTLACCGWCSAGTSTRRGRWLPIFGSMPCRCEEPWSRSPCRLHSAPMTCSTAGIKAVRYGRSGWPRRDRSRGCCAQSRSAARCSTTCGPSPPQTPTCVRWWARPALVELLASQKGALAAGLGAVSRRARHPRRGRTRAGPGRPSARGARGVPAG